MLSVNQVSKMPSLTNKYQFISSSELILKLQAKGFELHRSVETKPRKLERKGFQKHMLVFRHPSMTGFQAANGLIPELLVINSHDGSTSTKFMLGLFRLICSNGLISVSETFDSYRIRHMGNSIETKLDDCIERLQVAASTLVDRVTKLSNTQVSDWMRDKFALDMAAVRLENTPNVVTVDKESILKVVRQGDTGLDVFTTLNVIQEKLVNGGISYTTSTTTETGNAVRFNTTRRVKSIDQQVRLNKAVWAYAEKLVA